MPLHAITFPSGAYVPALGLGTWHMGESRSRRDDEVAALRLGLELGSTLVDTAEMYGDGGAEEVVGRAIVGRRDEVFLVSKFYPHHASRRELPAACERSLRRLATDRIDLYLLHWRGDVPLEETLETLERLQSAGKIRNYGVSNFDRSDLEEAAALSGGAGVACNQILYNLNHRGVEWDVLPWCRERKIPVMAYSPIGQGQLADHPRLRPIAGRHEATPAQIALAWVLHQPGVLAIPKASTPAHLRADRAAADLELTAEDLAELDRAFPPPDRKQPLAIL